MPDFDLSGPDPASYVQVTGAAALSMKPEEASSGLSFCALPFVRDSSFQASGTEATTHLRKKVGMEGRLDNHS